MAEVGYTIEGKKHIGLCYVNKKKVVLTIARISERVFILKTLGSDKNKDRGLLSKVLCTSNIAANVNKLIVFT